MARLKVSIICKFRSKNTWVFCLEVELNDANQKRRRGFAGFSYHMVKA